MSLCKITRDNILAGTSKVDITPPAGIKMCGYAARTDGARGIHDPLFARVVVIKKGKTSVAIVSTDLVWLYSGRIVKEAKKKWNLDYVILCGTHTHSGPTTVPGPWYSSMEDKVVAAIGKAMKNLFRARIGAGKGLVEGAYFAYNRRLVENNGSITMLWTNPGRRPVGPIDPMVRIIRIDDETGKPRAVMVNYAAHSVVLGAGNVHISADYPGAMCDYVERELGVKGKKCMAMFLQGGGGDVHPYEAILNGDEYGFEIMRQTGISIGYQALRVVKKIKIPRDKSGASIGVKESVINIARRDDKTKFEKVGVMAVVINNDIALAVISGEPFVQHQLDLVDKSPVKNTFLLGYAYFGRGIPLPTYLPSLQAAGEGGYGADGSVNFLEKGAGERMVDEAVASIKELS